jgi:hypothetical protein
MLQETACSCQLFLKKALYAYNTLILSTSHHKDKGSFEGCTNPPMSVFHNSNGSEQSPPILRANNKQKIV